MCVSEYIILAFILYLDHILVQIVFEIYTIEKDGTYAATHDNIYYQH